eukprot:TRINITY_DN8786_c0_g1_i1.p1 TRINITY_DN8786_c0_g1~~TRINITY_DN8786_c0_g1_i1.p1  ORF type:complete len:387 (+),score=92.21 TRINITY_DN8786_c0_g1_i1:285-1445(+)
MGCSNSSVDIPPSPSPSPRDQMMKEIKSEKPKPKTRTKKKGEIQFMDTSSHEKSFIYEQCANCKKERGSLRNSVDPYLCNECLQASNIKKRYVCPRCSSMQNVRVKKRCKICKGRRFTKRLYVVCNTCDSTGIQGALGICENCKGKGFIASSTSPPAISNTSSSKTKEQPPNTSNTFSSLTNYTNSTNNARIDISPASSNTNLQSSTPPLSSSDISSNFLSTSPSTTDGHSSLGMDETELNTPRRHYRSPTPSPRNMQMSSPRSVQTSPRASPTSPRSQLASSTSFEYPPLSPRFSILQPLSPRSVRPHSVSFSNTQNILLSNMIVNNTTNANSSNSSTNNNNNTTESSPTPPNNKQHSFHIPLITIRTASLNFITPNLSPLDPRS